jgi:hypothetical protein
MFSRTTESPDALEPIRGSNLIGMLHTAWQRAAGRDISPPDAPGGRLRAKSRAGLERIWGRADHELIGDLIRAVDAIAARCDEIAGRLSHQEIVTSEVAQALGQEVTRLRAAVSHLTDSNDPTGPSGSDA